MLLGIKEISYCVFFKKNHDDYVFLLLKFQINQIIAYNNIIIIAMSKFTEESYSINQILSSNSQISQHSSLHAKKKGINKNSRKKQYAFLHHICIRYFNANGQPFFIHFSEYKEMQTKSKNIKGVVLYGAKKFINRKKHQLTSCVKKEPEQQSQFDSKQVSMGNLMISIKEQPIYS